MLGINAVFHDPAAALVVNGRTAGADLASPVQTRLEEVLLELARWTHRAAGGPAQLTMAGAVALNCAANARIAAEGPAGRPMADTPREAMGLFGSAPVDLLALGPFSVRRGTAFGTGR
ncbi:hypothetical protein GCM10010170_000810 [Dactylosporangium salmoneum]|uniref:Carbamoyltransferase domain-containing protein n=1 Tax=Dactylosporangium salmoneum TaxID=53361 RepID=A0ABN3FAZ9_9ACTN